jgi:hypothetical protein
MRWTTVGVTIAVALLTSGVAGAAGGVGGKGETGNKGGTGPGADQTQAEPGSETDTSQVQIRKKGTGTEENPDTLLTKEEERKWSIGGTWETHRMIRQEDTGNSSSKVFNVLSFSASYDFTDRDRVSAGWGLSQYFIGDPGETGFRGYDIFLAYTRLIPLPERFNWRISPSFTIPISYYSQLASNITSPGLSTSLSRRFGDLLITASLSAGFSIDKHATAGGSDGFGGAPNGKWHAGGGLVAEYFMPFHHPLSMGLGVSDSYFQAYNVQNGNGCLTQVICQQGVVSDGVYTGQPVLQSYGGEIFARYVLPTVMGFSSDATIALASGDPSLGMNSLLHDGVVHPYLFYRNTAEVYGALSLRY